jgi:hypothetical protein
MEIWKLVRLRCPNKLTKVAAGTAHSWKKSYMNLSHDPTNLRINTCGNSSLILRIFSALLNFHFISFNFPEMVKCSLNDSNDLAQHAASSLFQYPSEKKSNLAFFYNTWNILRKMFRNSCVVSWNLAYNTTSLWAWRATIVEILSRYLWIDERIEQFLMQL